MRTSRRLARSLRHSLDAVGMRYAQSPVAVPAAVVSGEWTLMPICNACRRFRDGSNSWRRSPGCLDDWSVEGGRRRLRQGL